MHILLRPFLGLLLALTVSAPIPSSGQGSFVNWESAHVSPLDLTPDRSLLLAVNTADGRLEVFDVTSGTPVWLRSIPVGLDPVSVRARTNDEAWVVNWISDTVSVVDLTAGNVVATLPTDDEPADVEFAGVPERAFVSCSQTSRLFVFDPADLTLPPTTLEISAKEPRALTRSSDGSAVYLAAFRSGNRTTVLGGGMLTSGTFPPTVVSDPAGPYGGVNPPPNSGTEFVPAQNPTNPPAPPMSLIVRQRGAGPWLDDNGGDWTSLVSGPNAPLSGRPIGWQLLDHDLVRIDATTLTAEYFGGFMHQCSHLAVHPISGEVAVVGSDSRNEIRYEPNLSGVFNRLLYASWNPVTQSVAPAVDLNPHLDYLTSQVPQFIRDLSLGDPRAIVWEGDGSRAFVCGKGSNNVITIATDGSRIGAPIEVAEGPTGLALDSTLGRLYVLSHFGATITVIDTGPALVTAVVPFYDPTPGAIRTGRKHLYGTHETSGLGHLACASCHVDAKLDHLAWDLGDPSGAMRPFDQNCLESCEDWHPMKGPMMTQTLQDIIGKEPLHWRGDRTGIEEFNGAFLSLMADDAPLTDPEMQEFEDFLATITFPPNPFRNFDNSLPTQLPLPGHYSPGSFSPEGTPLPIGDAQNGLDRFRGGVLVGASDCVVCHTLPTGIGSGFELDGVGLLPIPIGPNGERHHSITDSEGSSNVSLKVAQLRNLYEKVGLELTQTSTLMGFGFVHDGTVDSLARFLSRPFFNFADDQEIADVVAFLLAFSGSDLPIGSPTDAFEPLGPESKDTHAAVGSQVTVHAGNGSDPALIQRLAAMQALSGAGAVGWVAKGVRVGETRGFCYDAPDWRSDRIGDPLLTTDDLRLGAALGAEITFTVVPKGTETRIGIDRDEDGFFDRDELDACSDPANPAITPLGTSCGDPEFSRADANGDGAFDIADPIRVLGFLFGGGPPLLCGDASDVNDDGGINIADAIYALAALFSMGTDPQPPFPGCGTDPTADGVGCVYYVPCP